MQTQKECAVTEKCCMIQSSRC